MNKNELNVLHIGELGVEKELFRGKKVLPKKLPEVEVHHAQETTVDCLQAHQVKETIKRFGYGELFKDVRKCSEVVKSLAKTDQDLAVVVMVINSLGAAEVIQDYGSKYLKHKYLEKLRSGDLLSCFALTSESAGSDATNQVDVAIRNSRGEYRLNFAKRYITLAPIADLAVVAAMLDGEMTQFLIDLSLPGVTVERHQPLSAGFPNGSIIGVDVIVPHTHVIGDVGKGWPNFVEALLKGRGVSLPALSAGIAEHTRDYVLSYSALRKQFKLPINKFEGIIEKQAEIVGLTAIIDSLRRLSLDQVANKIYSPVMGSIAKYWTTELSRTVVNHGMDILGGKGIQMGPLNRLGKAYMNIPIGITVEGANTMTRSLMIYGQGAMRCHFSLFNEYAAIGSGDHLKLGGELFKHAIFNLKTLFFGDKLGKKFYFISERCLMKYRENLKRKEHVSGLLADMLSVLVMRHAVLSSNLRKDVEKWSIQYLEHLFSTSYNKLIRHSKLLKLKMNRPYPDFNLGKSIVDHYKKVDVEIEVDKFTI